MIAVDFRKQQALDADPRAIQQINFTANLNLLYSRSSKRNFLEFSQGALKVL